MGKFLSLLLCIFISVFAQSQTLQPTGTINLCQGASQVLKVTGASGGSTYKWFSSTDGGTTWTPIANETASTYTAATPGSYRAIINTSNTTDTVGPTVIIVNPRPNPIFSFNNNTTCAGTSIQFTSTVSGGKAPFTYSWKFGDGSTSTNQNPSHSFSSLGCSTADFDVTLTVTDANSCSNAVTKTVTVKQLPDVQVKDVKNTFSPFSNCSNSPSISNPSFTVSIDNASPSSACINSYYVNWGDGTIQNGLTNASFPLTHIYNQLGTFNLVVTGVSSNGCSNSKTYVVVNQSNPAVGISAPGSTTGCAPSGFWFKLSQYELNSPGTIYVWNFGDGTPEVTWTTPVTVDSIFHLFSSTSCTQSGNSNQFTVKVTAKNGCDSTTATVNNIKIFQKPEVSFTAPASGCTSTSILFANTSIEAYNQGNCNRNTNYTWDFGDPSSSQNTSTDESPTHSYTKAGTYTVTLIAEGSCGKDTAIKTICIVSPPVSSFNLSSVTGCAPLQVDATNISNTLSNCTDATYQWTITYSATNCGNSSGFSFSNGTTASSINPSFNFSKPGTYTIKLTVTNACGSSTFSKDVIIKGPPRVSIISIANSCGPVTLTPSATINNCGTNALTYLWTFTGGSPSSSSSSLPGSVIYNNTGSNGVSVAVSNECGITTANQNFIISPLPDLSIPSNKVYCANETAGPFNFTSTTQGAVITWSTNNTNIGLPTASGTGNIAAFTVKNTSTSPLVATITVKATANGCTSIQTFTITVNPKPSIPTVTSPVNYCQGAKSAPLVASFTPGNSLNWYTVASGGTPSTTAPTPSTATVGTTNYYVSQMDAATGCESSRAIIAVTINSSTTISIGTTTNPLKCSGSTGSIILNGVLPNTSYLLTYTKNGSTVSTTAISSQGGSITLNNLSAGNYDNIQIKLNGCSSNIVGPVTLTDPNPPATPTAGSETNLCTGGTLHLSASSSTSGVTFNWTGPNGYSSNLQNPIINNVTSLNGGTYTVTVALNGCSSSSQTSVVINPRPVAPTVSSPIIYCLNAEVSPLTASGTNLNWYTSSNLTGGSPNAPLPSTLTAETQTYYVTQTNSLNCESPASVITITVNPSINGNNIGSDQTLCSGSSAKAITQQGTLTGGSSSFTYQWISSLDNGATWTVIPSQTSSSYNPGVVTVTTKYKRIVQSGGCIDTSSVVTITIQGSLTNYDVTASQTICAGSKPALLEGQVTSGGNGAFTYQWQSSPLSPIKWNDLPGETNKDFQPPHLTSTTLYRRVTNSGSCSANSGTITITVNPIPVIGSVQNVTYCNNALANPITFSSTPSSNVTYNWTNDNTLIGLAASGTSTIPSFTAINNNNAYVPITSTISIEPTYTNNSVSCTGIPTTFSITVLPNISIDPIADITVCTGTQVPVFSPKTNAGTFAGSSIMYNWTVAGSGLSLSNGSGDDIPAFTATNNTSSDLISTITVTPIYTLNGKSCSGTPISYKVIVKSATPAASAGPDAILCAEVNYTMKGSLSATTTGNWTQVSGNSVAITDPTAPTSTITGLEPSSSYSFVWSVTGFASCPATKDTVVITIDPQVTNTIDNITQTICSGGAINIMGNLPSGGNGTYSYQWQSSTNGTTWTDLNGQTNQSLLFTPSQTIFVRRIVTSLPCITNSQPTQIIVQPPVSDNTIGADQKICIGNSAAILTGAVPTGANGIYAYQWQLFNGTIWEDIPNATLKDYSPGVLIQTTKFRRNVSTNLCTGPQSNNSNEVTVTINPDAKAAFTAVKDSSCSPFLIDGNVIILQNDPSRNKDYQWYADGRFLGQGSNFPGYVINNAGDSVKIKLVAISNFGCLNDSIEKSFYTYITAKPSFTVTDTVGCGPLSVSFTNTTPNINSFQYLWDFGNGSTSSQSSPSAVTFLPNPKYGDTTYIVKLSVVTNCDTLIAFKSIRVKSKPKALFAPNSTVGCSPMRVIFSNTSLGIGNSYIWNFGDGSAPVSTNQIDTIGHTFYTGIRDTFYVKLFAGNECGIDSLTYAIVVSPNKIVLDFALNGNEQSGCTPHTVNFINNSKGASAFTWNFGDGSILNTTRNIDTVGHTYVSPGTYIITLNATNGCSDTSSTETIVVYPRPTAAFNVDLSTACIGETITFENNSDSATSYFWRFDDGSTSTLTSPSHAFSNAGTYSVVLKAYRFNAPGSVCEDSTVRNIEIVSNKPGAFIATDTIGYCAPFSVTFTNQNTPYISADWDFGDGTFGKGNTINHTFLTAGNYLVKLTVVVPGGCTYITTHTIRVLGPSGSLSYSKEYLCNNASITLQVQANNTDSLIFNFGDGTSLTTTTNMVSHVYQNAGIYLPSVTLKNKAGCSILLEGVDSVKVDKVKAGFSTVQQLNCGATLVNFTDTSIAFFGKTSVQWDLGDGTFSNGTTISHQYVTSGIYPVKMVVYGNSGCSDTIAQNLIIKVNNKPKAEIQGNTVSCVGYLNTYKANVSSIDSIRLIKWSLSNGVTESRNPVNFTFTQAGKYTLSLVIGTVNGCYDTASLEIQINPSPTVVSTTDMNICRGASVRLTATGTGNNGYSWSPVGDLSCTNCPDPIASPLQTTPFVVRGTNSFGCSASDTTVITVIQPLQLKVFPTDTICIGSSTNLLASGASSYSWSPSSGLSNTSIPNPIASPDVTTSYRVVGYDGYNCFTDTAFVLVAVGQYPIVNLGPDLILSTGTMQTLKSVVQNGPIVNWLWTPGKDLSCNTCALPIAEVKKDITYTVEVTNNYGCSATDTIMVKAFCQSAQVFIPNAFTPDGDGINDVLMVRGQGIVMVKTFRIFNRWGEVVFERSDFPPNNPGYGWNGKINGIAGGPDVFVYTADVVCENGSTYTYKGNVSIIK